MVTVGRQVHQHLVYLGGITEDLIIFDIEVFLDGDSAWYGGAKQASRFLNDRDQVYGLNPGSRVATEA